MFTRSHLDFFPIISVHCNHSNCRYGQYRTPREEIDKMMVDWRSSLGDMKILALLAGSSSTVCILCIFEAFYSAIFVELTWLLVLSSVLQCWRHNLQGVGTWSKGVFYLIIKWHFPFLLANRDNGDVFTTATLLSTARDVLFSAECARDVTTSQKQEFVFIRNVQFDWKRKNYKC